jgi:hypothetical protein
VGHRPRHPNVQQREALTECLTEKREVFLGNIAKHLI